MLFLANSASIVVLVDVRSSKLDERDVYRGTGGEHLESVAYSAHTDTLFICTRRSKGTHTVCSFASEDTDSEWRECQCLEVPLESARVALRALSDGRVLLANENGALVIEVLSVDESRALQTCAPIRLPGAHAGFDSKLAGVAGETWLAVARRRSEPVPEDAVALFRVVGVYAEELSSCPLREPRSPLFCGDSLLVYARTADRNGWRVYEFGTGGGDLEPRRVILSGRDLPATGDSNTPEWCVVKDELVAWNFEHDSLTIYSMSTPL